MEMQQKGEPWNVPHTNVRWPRGGWPVLSFSHIFVAVCRVLSPFQWRNNYDCVGSIDFSKITIFVGFFSGKKYNIFFCMFAHKRMWSNSKTDKKND